MDYDRPDAAVSVNSVRRVVLASFIGTTIEWYDFFLYGTAAALVFNRLFFPTLDPFAGTMASFATYAVGFFARPVGGVVFGHFGDRLGRKSMLVTTLMLMGTATFLIGVLPTYEQIGAPASSRTLTAASIADILPSPSRRAARISCPSRWLSYCRRRIPTTRSTVASVKASEVFEYSGRAARSKPDSTIQWPHRTNRSRHRVFAGS